MEPNSAELDPIDLLETDRLYEHWQQIVSCALKQVIGKSSSQANRLRSVLDKCISLNGPRKQLPSKAIGAAKSDPNKLAQLSAEIARKVLSQRKHQVLAALLLLWAETELPFLYAAKQALSQHNLPIDGFTNRFVIGRTEQYQAVVHELTTAFPEQDSAVAIWMIIHASGVIPLDESAETPSQTLDNPVPASQALDNLVSEQPAPVSARLLPIWHELYLQLEALSPDDAAWELAYAEDFIEQLQALVKQRRYERGSARKLLTRALHQLREEQAEPIAFLPLTSITYWVAEICPLSQAQFVAEEVDRLQALLANYQGIQQRLKIAQNSFEQNEFFKQIPGLQTAIFDLYGKLSDLLMPGKQVQSRDSDPSVGEPEPPDLPEHGLSISEMPEPDVEEVIVASIPLSSGLAEVRTAEPIDLPGESKAGSASPTHPISLETEQTKQVSAELADPDIQAKPELHAEQIDQQLVALGEQQTPCETIGDPQVVAVDTAAALAEVGPLIDRPDTSVPTDSAVANTEQLSTSRPALEALAEGSEDHAHMHMLADMIASDDLPLAYWLARSLTARGKQPAIPERLIAAAYGARLLSFAHEGVGPMINELQEIGLLHEVGDNSAHQLIAAAASLRPALLAPNTGLVEWVAAPTICPSFRPLAAAVRRFADRKITLRTEDLTDVADAGARERVIGEIVADARTWMRDAPLYQTMYVPATVVWRILVGQKGELREMLAIVAEDRRADIHKLQQQLVNWRDPENVIKQINMLDKERRGIYWIEIDREALDQLKRDIAEACTLAGRWHSIVSSTSGLGSGGRWRFEQTMQLCTDVQRALPELWEALVELAKNSPPLIAAAAFTLQCALAQVCEMLRIELPNTDAPAARVLPAISLNESLQRALTRRLWLFPEMQLNKQAEPSARALATFDTFIAKREVRERTIADALEAWLGSEDYRFIEPLLAMIIDQHTRDNLTRRAQESRSVSTAALRAQIDASRNQLDLAFADSIIDDAMNSANTTVIQSIDPGSCEDYPDERAKLLRLNQELEQARDRRIADLKHQWEVLSRALADGTRSIDEQAKIQAKITDALTLRDPRLVEEELDLVRRVIAGSSLPMLRQTHNAFPFADLQREFLKQRDQLGVALKPGLNHLLNAFNAGQPINGLAQRPTEQGRNALSAWRQIKQTPAKLGLTQLKVILTFLGLNEPEISETATSSPTLRRTWSVAQVTRSQPNSRPIPQFGSLAPSQTIILLWESPESLTTAILRTGVQVRQAILIYFGTLNAQQRRDITRLGRGTEKISPLALAVLDEPLLLALTQAPETVSRFQLFLHYSLPLTLLNPYMPNNRGNIPSEIFYGRQDLVEKLQDPRGSCIIYGGRQLGKSALLYEAKRRFERKSDHYATVEDIYSIGESPEHPPSNLWLRLRNAFRDKFKLTGQVKTERSEDILARIRRVFDENPACHVLMMLDEADAFLDADARDRFQVVLDLRRLMSETSGRFKVVFAGLHNVQRFASLPNQPLAQFGKPICIGPLEPSDAIGLVSEPLNALGYHFRDTASVARVLSYTNYHAGLLQIFCYELLQHLQARTRSAEAPAFIEQADIDQTYVRIKGSVQERFNWTLSLDLRYKAIALALIANQMGAPHLYAEAYWPSDIRQLVEVWWPQGFREVTEEQLHGLLDEMCGLGILIQTHEGAYRLRSPNLVRLLGSDRMINSELDQLQRIQPLSEAETSTFHALLDLAETPKPYSPLTYSQERLLNKGSSGVTLVFASDATGLSRLPLAFTRFLSDEARQELSDQAIPQTIIRNHQLGTWLSQQQANYKHLERLIVTARLTSALPEELAATVRQAHDWSKQNYTRKPFIRVAILFDPLVTATWLQLPREQRISIENTLDSIISLHAWGEHAVHQRLLYENKLTVADTCQQVMKATGGWMPLLDELLRRCAKSDDPRPIARELTDELSLPKSAIAEMLWHSLGELPSAARRLLNFIHREAGGEATFDLIEPGFLGEPRLSDDECNSALIYLDRMGYLRLSGDTITVNPVIRTLMERL